MANLAIRKPELPYVGAEMFIGADPEIFVSANGVVVPAFGFLGDQNKKMKFSVDKCFELHNDGFQAEFTVCPETCLNFVSANIAKAMRELFKVATARNLNAELVPEPIVEIPTELLLAAPVKYVKMGCMPSENAYGIHGESIIDGKDIPIRFAGSHLHFSLEENLKKPPTIERIVQTMDCFAGVASVALFGGKADRERRRYYGLPGEYRLPKHGVEYRSLSAAMLRHPVYYHILFDLARFGLKMGRRNGLMEAHWSTPQETVVKCMMQGSKKLAREIIKSEPVFKSYFKGRYPNNAAKILAMFLGEAKLQDEGIVRSWNLLPKMGWYSAGMRNGCGNTAVIR